MVEIRLAREGDGQKLEDLLVFNNGERLRELAQNYIRASFSDDYRKPIYVLAVSDGKIIGAAAFSEELFTTQIWGISWVSVHENHRNKGIGKKIVNRCVEEIQKRIEKRSTVLLNTYPNKTKLYEYCGFQGAGEDADGGCLMVKYVEPLNG